MGCKFTYKGTTYASQADVLLAIKQSINEGSTNSVEQDKPTNGFQGYKGRFENLGKGTPQGDGKDKAMREVANSAIVELASNKDSSSKTTLGKLGVPKEGDKVIMLARNGELSGRSLRFETKEQIRQANLDGTNFVVGDMPGVDSQFIDYLQEIGAKFTIYHTGTTSRIQVQQSNTNQPTEQAGNKKDTINVYWEQAESLASTRILSNLAPRKFTYKSADGITREYGSVEHAYQTLKSGSFDQITYDKYVKAGGYGTKIRGRQANTAISLLLMKDLVVQSFVQNSASDAAKKLLQYDNFTHNTNEVIDRAFLAGLKLAQEALEQSKFGTQATTTQVNQQEKETIQSREQRLINKFIQKFNQFRPDIELIPVDNIEESEADNVFNQRLTSTQQENIANLKQSDERWNKYSDEDIQRFIDSVFPGSKVKDIVWHGTGSAEKISRFKNRTYFSNLLEASRYAAWDAKNRENYAFEENKLDNLKTAIQVIPAIIDLKNPKHLKNAPYAETEKNYENYDGIYSEETVDPLGGEELQIVAFEPEQIYILSSDQAISDMDKFVENNSLAQESGRSLDSVSNTQNQRNRQNKIIGQAQIDELKILVTTEFEATNLQIQKMIDEGKIEKNCV